MKCKDTVFSYKFEVLRCKLELPKTYNLELITQVLFTIRIKNKIGSFGNNNK